MSTSDPRDASGLTEGAPQGPTEGLNMTSMPGSLPDVSAMTRLANEFFRAIPSSAISGSGLPAGIPSAVPVQAINPAFETRLPQSGVPMPGMPAIPSAGRFPVSADVAGVSTSVPDVSDFAPGQMPLPGVPPAAPGITASGWQQDPRSGASPFSLPMPEFDQALFPPFEQGIPALPPLPPLRNEDDARSALTESSSFYFLERSGLFAEPLFAESRKAQQATSVPAANSALARPAAVGDLKLPRQQFEMGSIRRDFPILNERVNGHPLIWLDNAATTQKPQSVIDRISYFYEHENSNIHRAAHELAARATDAYEDARNKVARFLNASSSKEIVFVRGATEAINLVAQAWGRRHINKGDEIVISWIEHHANIVPWQMLCAEKGACLRVAPVDDDGQILLDEYEKLLGPKTRLVSFTQVSNALGTMTPAHQMVQMAHRYGARVLVDGAQAVSHLPIDVQSLDCDFYVFSGHKVFAPTGIGVLYGKPEVLAETPPWQGGGNMIVDVTFEKTTYQPPPGRLEAGTGTIADAVGLGAAIDYLEHIGMPNVARYEHELLVYATEEMLRVPGLRIIGTAKEKASVLSFVLEGFKTEQVGAALNKEGIAVRSGHHCAQPTLRRFGLETTVRPSLALYNNFADIDAMVAALFRLKNAGV